MCRVFYICLPVTACLLTLIKEVREEEIMEIEEMILRHEGFRAKPYKCTAGKLTVGIGRNLEDRGITKDEALYLLRNDIAECEADLMELFEDFPSFSDSRRKALIDMRFNLGAKGFRRFVKMVGAIRANDFGRAAKEARDSKWYRQVGLRGKEITAMILDEGLDLEVAKIGQ